MHASQADLLGLVTASIAHSTHSKASDQNSFREQSPIPECAPITPRSRCHCHIVSFTIRRRPRGEFSFAVVRCVLLDPLALSGSSTVTYLSVLKSRLIRLRALPITADRHIEGSRHGVVTAHKLNFLQLSQGTFPMQGRRVVQQVQRAGLGDDELLLMVIAPDISTYRWAYAH
jgi:hypothetical protein